MTAADRRYLQLAADLLDETAETVGNRGSNDWEFPATWSADERRQAVLDFHELNGDPEEVAEREDFLMDYCAMSLAAANCRTLAASPAAPEASLINDLAEWLRLHPEGTLSLDRNRRRFCVVDATAPRIPGGRNS